MRTPRAAPAIVSGLVLVFMTSAGEAQKRPLEHEDYDLWMRITGQQISDDGRWVLYHLTNEARDPVLIARAVQGTMEYRVERGEGGQLDEGGRFVAFRIKPARDSVKKARAEKVPNNRLLQDSLGILDLTNGSIVRYERVKSFRMPEEAGGWLAFHHLAPPSQDTAGGGQGGAPAGGGRGGQAGGGRGGQAGETDATRKEDGTVLVLRNLATGAEQRIEWVADYAFSKDGARLAYITSRKDGSGDAAHIIETAAGTTTTLLSGKGSYKSLAFDEAGRQLAFLTTRDDAEAKTPLWALYHWDAGARAAGGEPARRVAAAGSAGIPGEWTVSENQNPSFSKNGGRLFFGTAPKPLPEIEEVPEDERVVVDVWNWRDPLLQPMQLRQLEQERRRSWTAVAHLRENGRIVQLGSEEVPDIVLGMDRDADLAMGRSNVPYRQEISWGESGSDIYLVDVRNGTRTKVLEYVRGGVSLSPSTKYLSWFDGDNRQWFVYDIATRRTTGVSEAVPYPVHNELHDQPSLPSSYGSVGWTKDDAQLLLYDRHDVWAIDPTGSIAPRNLTDGVGRREGIRFRVVDMDPDEQAIDPASPLVLSAFHYTTKQEGFYRDGFAPTVRPVRHLMDDRSFGGGFFGAAVRKAADADVLLLTRGSFTEFPDLYVSAPDFTGMRRISDANPQQSQFVWGTSELVEWRSANDNTVLQGVLYKPENFDPAKKWPMMVYFYERLSDNLNDYVVPAPGGSSINISFYVSRGYLVFTPDIPYQVGYPGESAFDAVVPGVQSLVAKGFVDENAIGVQGHSWGGYQISYLVTKTNIFKAAEAGAPVANMTSAYGGIRWESGMSRMFQYEKTQSRIGGTLWDAPLHFIENSPLFWADKVETPLLMMHNDEDGAVPWEQGIEYFVALRRLQKPVWMLNYNGEAHGLRREQNRKDWTIRMQQFFDHYLKGAPAPVWLEEGVPAILKGRTLGLELIGPKTATNEERNR
ncbi:MAG: prolyl oligopeptidase family serine peptidase [Gemmatimonadetes bacterium]|nr:prolyl oligopeptidase family serine peptidase [Gemmatimonadota bacterium]